MKKFPLKTCDPQGGLVLGEETQSTASVEPVVVPVAGFGCLFAWSGFQKIIGRWAFLAVAVIIIQSGTSFTADALEPGQHTFVGASSNNFPPVNILDEEGDLTGFGRDLSDAVIKAIGGTVTHIDSGVWTEVLEWLASGKADFIHDTGFAEERLAYLDYSEPILSMDERIFINSERTDINSFEDLTGKTVACVNQHITHIYLKKFPEIGCVIVKRPVDGILAVLNNDVDAFIFPQQIALYYAYSLRLRSSIKIVGEPLRTLNWHMTVRKGNKEMVALLNRGIAKVRASGEYQRIYDKWFGITLFKGHTTNAVKVFVGSAIALSLLAAGLIFSFIHITKMKKTHAQKDKAETALSVSENRLQEIIESQSELISRFRPDDKRTFVNKAYVQFLGKPEEEILASALHVYIHPDDAERFRENLNGLSIENPRFEMESRIHHHDGEYHWIHWVTRAFFDKAGNIIECQSTGRDITKRKKVETVSERLGAAIDALAESVTLFDANDRLVFANQKTLEINQKIADVFQPGTTYETILRAIVGKGLMPDSEGHEEEWIAARLEKHKNPSGPFEVCRQDGICLLLQETRLPDGGVAILASDITERKRMETLSDRLAAAIDTLAVNIVLYDADDRIVFRNKAWKVFNKNLADIAKIGTKYEAFLRAMIDRGMTTEAKGNEDEWYKQRLERHRNPGEPFEVGRQDGRHLLIQVQRLPDGGRATIATDITRLKKTEKDLVENEELLETIIGNVANGLITMDEKGTILSFTGKAEITFGYKADEIIGQNVKMLMPEPTRGNHDGFLAQFRKAGEKHIIGQPREVMALRKDGAAFPLEISITELHQGDKRIFMGTVLDLTEHKRAEVERREIEVQLRQSQKLQTIGTLASGIAHDFNNILSPIMGYVDMALLDLPEGEQTHKNMVQVRLAAERAKALVGQMLSAAGQGELEPQPVQVTEIVEEALRLLRPSLPSMIEIRLNLDKACQAVRADPTQIHQVVMNLCTNAYQAMGEQGGVLTIDVEMVEGGAVLPGREVPKDWRYVRLNVSDTGPGMEARQVARIFKPFYTTKAPGEGTGLGLSVVHGIISSHGGAITVDSAPGKGTTFHIYLPVMEGLAETEPGTTSKSPASKGNEHVLYVDDEIEIAEMGRQMLERLGYRVTIAAGAGEALEVFQANPGQFDIVVTDYTMPKITGAELAEKLTKLRPGLPIVLLTGSGEIITKARKQNTGISSYLMKPIVMHELSIAVRTALEKAAE